MLLPNPALLPVNTISKVTTPSIWVPSKRLGVLVPALSYPIAHSHQILLTSLQIIFQTHFFFLYPSIMPPLPLHHLNIWQQLISIPHLKSQSLPSILHRAAGMG